MHWPKYAQIQVTSCESSTLQASNGETETQTLSPEHKTCPPIMQTRFSTRIFFPPNELTRSMYISFTSNAHALPEFQALELGLFSLNMKVVVQKH